MSNRRVVMPGKNLRMLGTEFALVEESGLVRHRCGHEVFWEMLPGVDGVAWRARIQNSDCPCCGGETGYIPPHLEWPDHYLASGVGLAHCHSRQLSCNAVDAGHRQGLHLKDHQRG